MRFSKQDLFEELKWFIPSFAKSVSRMFEVTDEPHSVVQSLGSPRRRYGLVDRAILHIDGAADEPNWETISKTSLWWVLSNMYDFGVDGIVTPETNVGDGAFADVELFVLGLDGLGQYFEEDEGAVPKLCQSTVTLAVARDVLGGGQPYRIDPERPFGYLTFAELALLADMDERSVRNAANPKLPNPLLTENIGKRSLIAVEEAKRWLAGRKGFVPTKPMQQEAPSFMWTVKEVALELPIEIVLALNRRCDHKQMSTEEYLRTILAPEIRLVQQEREESQTRLVALAAARKESL